MKGMEGERHNNTSEALAVLKILCNYFHTSQIKSTLKIERTSFLRQSNFALFGECAESGVDGGKSLELKFH